MNPSGTDTGKHPGDTAEARHARSVRLVALAIGLPMLLLLIAFMVMPFIVRDEVRLNAVGPIPAAPGLERGGVRFAGAIHLWQIDGRIGADAERRVHLAFDLRGPDGQPSSPGLAISLELDMPEHDMPPLSAPIRRTGAGAYASTIPVPMDGQWRLRLVFPEVTGALLFTIDP